MAPRSSQSVPGRALDDAIGEPTLADAIPGRLVHNFHRMPLVGESMRKCAVMTRRAEPELHAPVGRLRGTAAHDAVKRCPSSLKCALIAHRRVAADRNRMAMNLQPRSPQHGYRWSYNRRGTQNGAQVPGSRLVEMVRITGRPLACSRSNSLIFRIFGLFMGRLFSQKEQAYRTIGLPAASLAWIGWPKTL